MIRLKRGVLQAVNGKSRWGHPGRGNGQAPLPRPGPGASDLEAV